MYFKIIICHLFSTSPKLSCLWIHPLLTAENPESPMTKDTAFGDHQLVGGWVCRDRAEIEKTERNLGLKKDTSQENAEQELSMFNMNLCHAFMNVEQNSASNSPACWCHYAHPTCFQLLF